MRAAQGGDQAALDLLLRRHYDRVFAICRRLCGNHADGLDATQEALITIARRIDRYDGRAAFGTWAYRVATNACLDELRRRRRRPQPVDPLEGPIQDGRAITAGRAAAPVGAGDLAASVADRLDLDQALSRLPTEFRVAVVLRDLCALDYAEIAEVVGIPIGTVRSRIARARAALARDLGADGNQTPPKRRQSTQQPPDSAPLGMSETP